MQNRMYYSEEARQRAYSERTTMAIIFLVLGLSIGAAIALLFAPQSGSDSREQLSRNASHLRDEAEDRVRELT